MWRENRERPKGINDCLNITEESVCKVNFFYGFCLQSVKEKTEQRKSVESARCIVTAVSTADSSQLLCCIGRKISLLFVFFHIRITHV